MQYDAFGNIERSIHDLFLCKRGNELMYKFDERKVIEFL